MYADIIPLRRLPRRIGALTYSVPDELQNTIQIGQLVTIPFRAGDIFGLVINKEQLTTFVPSSGRGMSNEQKNAKDLQSFVADEPFLSTEQLKFLQTMSTWYGVSPSVIATMMLPPLQKKKLAKAELIRLPPPPIRVREHLCEARPGGGLPTYHAYSSQKEHAEAIQSCVEKTTLILVPEVYLIDEVRQLLSVEEQTRAVVWHSQITQKQQFERWLQIRNGEKNIIIGTRGAIFLPFPELQTILIDYEHDENHKHWDQAPRFHVKDVVEKLRELYGADLHLASFSMSAESYFAVHKGLINEQLTISKEQKNGHETIVNMADERRGGNYNIFSDKIAKAILETAGDIFLYINRKGFATAVGCNACGFIARCPTCQLPLSYSEKEKKLRCHYCGTSIDMILSCPKCHATIVKLFGAGTELVETEARKLLGKSTAHEIIRIENDYDAETEYSKKPRLIIGTDKAFPAVRWDKTSLVVFVDIDKQLAIPEFRAGEDAWQRIAEANFRRQSGSAFFVQTFNPQHLIFRSLVEPDRWYRTELNARQKLGYPPYIYLVRYLFAHEDQKTAEQAAGQLYRNMRFELTKTQNQAMVHAPLPLQPHYYRRKFWYTIIAKLPVENWQEDLAWLNAIVPDNWKIDPNPISLLSP